MDRPVARWVVAAAGLVFILAWVTLVSTFEGYTIPSGAMEPTLQPGDRLLVRTRGAASAGRGDIVVFRDSESSEFVSRVVAVGGDTVESRDDRLFVNGRKVDEPYLAADMPTVMRSSVTVPTGHVFVMGDNRTNSADSRVRGPVPVDDLMGRAMFRYWPVGRAGRI